jgi:hypothetical protein
MKKEYRLGSDTRTQDINMTPNPIERCLHPACSALLELATRWLAEAEIHDANGNADCGTGSDVPYAMASKCREHAEELERIVYAIVSPNTMPFLTKDLSCCQNINSK